MGGEICHVVRVLPVSLQFSAIDAVDTFVMHAKKRISSLSEQLPITSMSPDALSI
jgi:hypothetical protein